MVSNESELSRVSWAPVCGVDQNPCTGITAHETRLYSKENSSRLTTTISCV
jgi:hypothetical protein